MLLIAIISFSVAAACLTLLVQPPLRTLALDHPNERSLHSIPVPRTGGIAIAAGVAGSVVLLESSAHELLLIALLLVVVSFFDDMMGLATYVRFAFHVLAAAGALTLIAPSMHPVWVAILVVAMAWLTNLFNFMDGMDGLAGGMSVVGFGACAIAAAGNGPAWLAALCVAISASALAFLLFNFPPAKIFMGDSGSISLGFLAGALGIAGWQAETWQLWFPALVFSPFLMDATATLFKRALRGENLLQAHREHYYQRMVRMGIGRRHVVLTEYMLMIATAGCALFARSGSIAAQAAAVATCIIGYVALGLWIDKRWARHRDDASK